MLKSRTEQGCLAYNALIRAVQSDILDVCTAHDLTIKEALYCLACLEQALDETYHEQCEALKLMRNLP